MVDPVTGTGIAAWLGFGGATAAVAAGTVAISGIITAIVINIAIAYVLGKILAPSFNDSRDVRAMQDTVRDNIMPRRVIYGQAVTGGPLLWYETTGVDNYRLTLIVALTGHPVEDILGVWIDEEYLDISGLAASPYDQWNSNWLNNDFDNSWNLTEGIYGRDTEDGIAAARMVKNTGWGFADHTYVTDETLGYVQADQARGELIASLTSGGDEQWLLPSSVKTTRDSQTGRYTSAGRKVTNCAYMYATFAFDPEIWKGFPKLKFHVKGKRLYNPALDPALVAYGADSAGTHSLYDPDTWEWSEDWTLAVLDYLLDPYLGMRARASTNANEIDNVLYNEIDWAQAIESYQKSSESTARGISPGDRYYGNGAGPRYTINGVFEVDATPVSIMESLLSCGAGKLIYSQGKYKIRAGYYKAPASEADIINEDMIIGPMTIQTHTPRSDLFNKVGGSHINAGYDLDVAPNNTGNKPEFVSDEFPIVDPSAPNNPYELEDGEPLIQELDFPFTIRTWEAQRLAKIQLERIRRGITITFKATLEVLKYSVGDTIYLEILNNSKYANEVFFNRLGLDDQVQVQDSPKTSPYYKQFMIMDMQYNEDYTIDVVLLEEAAPIYDWNQGDASPDTGTLGSEVPVIIPAWPVKAPTFLVPSPDVTVEEVATATGIDTLVYFTTLDPSSPDLQYLGRPFIREYILQYGRVTAPSESDPENRVGIWRQAGTFTVTRRTDTTQGPISITDLYINNTSNFDFRVRGIADDSRLSPWTYYSTEIGSDWSPTEPGTANRYYIKPINGTAIRNGTGTLTVEATRVDGSGETTLTSGNIKLYEGSVEITTANGYASPSDGYTGTFDSGDITESVTIELRDDTIPRTYDTITLVDIDDGTAGDDATYGYIEVDGPMTWIWYIDEDADPSDASTQLNVTFVRGGTEVARWARIINRTDDALSDGGPGTHPGVNLNTTSITPTVTISGTNDRVATVDFNYTEAPYGTVIVTEVINVAARILPRYYINPVDGTALKNSAGTLTVEARRASARAGDILVSQASNKKLYVGSVEVNVTNGYPSPSDGVTGTFGSADITGDVLVELRDDTIPRTYDTITLVDVTDGTSSVAGYIEADNGLAWRKAEDGGAWTPATTTTDLDCTFVQEGADVARVAYRLTLNTVDGTITGSSTEHTGGDLDTGRVTITEIPSGLGTENANVRFTYSFGGDTAVVEENVFSVIGGSTGSDAITAYLRVSSPYVVTAPDGTFDGGYNNPTSSFYIWDGNTDVTALATYSIVGSSTLNGLTISIHNDSPNQGDIDFSGANWTSNSELFTVRANYGGNDYDLPIRMSKVNKGYPGRIIYSSIGAQTVTADNDGTNYTLPPNPVSQITLYDNDGTDITDTSPVTFSVLSPDTVDGLTASVSNSIGTKGQISLTDGTWTGDEATFTFQIDHDGFTYYQSYSISKALGGTTGTPGSDAITINYTNNSHAVPVTNLGDETWTGSGGLFYVYDGGTALTLDSNTQSTTHPSTLGTYVVNITAVSGDTLTEPTITGATTTTCTLGDWAGNLTTATVYRVTAYITDSGGTQHTLSTDLTLSPSDQGGDGTDGDDAFAINYTNNSHAVPVTNLGDETWTGSGGNLYVYEGNTLLTLNTNTQTGSYAGLSNSEYNVDITAVSGDTLTEPTITGQTTTTCTLSDWAGDLTTATVYRISVYIQGSGGQQATYEEYVTLSPSDQGGDGTPGSDAISVHYSNNSHAVPVTNLDVEDWTGSGGEFRVYEGTTLLTLDSNTQGTGYPSTPGRYVLDITHVNGDTLTEPTITGSGTTLATLSVWAGDLTQATLYRIRAYITTTDSTQTNIPVEVTLAPADQGADGSQGNPGSDGLNNATVYLYQRTATESPTPGAPSNSVDYDFSTGSLASPNNDPGNSWLEILPGAGSPILWMISAVASGTGATDSIGTGEWSVPEILAIDGADGKVGWGHDLVFSSTDIDTVAWTSGSIWTAAGTTYSIDAGNTGNMSARTYIYLDSDVSTTVLQTTTNAQTAVGENKILVTVAEDINSPNTGTEAFFQVFGGAGGLKLTADELAANSIVANNINASFYEGRAFTGGLFQTRNPSTTSPYDVTARVTIQEDDPQIGIYTTYGGTQPDTQIFGITETASGSELYILGDFVAGSLHTAQMYSSAGIQDLADRLGYNLPSSTTGGQSTVASLPDSIPTSLADTELDTNIYSTGLQQNTITFTLYDNDDRTGSAFTAPTWDVNIYYTDDINSPVSWTQVPGADWTLTGNTGFKGDPDLYWFSINATRSVSWTPASPFVSGDTIYYMIRTQLISGDSNDPRFTALNAQEALTGGSTLDNMTDTDLTGAAQYDLLFKSSITTWSDTGGNLKWDPDGIAQFTANGEIRTQTAYMKNSASSGSNPTLIPRIASATTGIGSNASDEISLIASGAEKFRISLSEIRAIDSIHMTELSSAGSDVTAYGQWWVKSDTPNVPWFTDDAGFDYPLGYAKYKSVTNNNTLQTAATENIGSKHINAAWWKSDTTVYTLTLEASGSYNFPVGAQLSIWNSGSSGNLQVADVTNGDLYIMDGSSTTLVTANTASIAPGGYATLVRETASVYRIMGAGVS